MSSFRKYSSDAKGRTSNEESYKKICTLSVPVLVLFNIWETLYNSSGGAIITDSSPCQKIVQKKYF
jgi:hypothetical protein